MIKNQPIFLYGPSGSGKSTVGKNLARSLNIPFIDLDKKIEETYKQKIPQIFADEGESGFREKEKQILFQLPLKRLCVIALGGGSLLDAESEAFARENGLIFVLHTSNKNLFSRLSKSKNPRPLIKTQEDLSNYLAKRSSHYNSFDLQISTNNNSVADTAFEIQTNLGIHKQNSQIPASNIYIDNHLKDSLFELGNLSNTESNLLIVSDSNVAPFHLDFITNNFSEFRGEVHTMVLDAGEKNKTLASVIKIWDACLKHKLDRKSTIIALGGGVIGDMVGFAAATIYRGISWINIPTTLLSMVDASLGGKTGINLPQGKNLAGSFHPPTTIIIDPTYLSTLPKEEITNGLAEIIKHGIIASPDLFHKCTPEYINKFQNWVELVKLAASIKIRIVEKDPKEANLRESLNFGHNIGHAIEKLSNFSLKHGEAISIGFVIESQLGEHIGVTNAGTSILIKDKLSSLGLPTKLPSTLSISEIIDQLAFDKKRVAKNVYFSLPTEIGNVRTKVLIPDIETLLKAVIK